MIFYPRVEPLGVFVAPPRVKKSSWSFEILGRFPSKLYIGSWGQRCLTSFLGGKCSHMPSTSVEVSQRKSPEKKWNFCWKTIQSFWTPVSRKTNTGPVRLLFNFWGRKSLWLIGGFPQILNHPNRAFKVLVVQFVFLDSLRTFPQCWPRKSYPTKIPPNLNTLLVNNPQPRNFWR